ncbi:MAG: Gfo/Idh/MocA family oxidoreductase [Victivallales bacterium]|nr:Gfo/Idh/MocA family oxidoreductase [Victivallales bacterium]
MKTYRVGLIGCGFIGKVHAYGHLNIPLFFDLPGYKSKITMVCAAHPESARKNADKIGDDIQTTTDFRNITENPDIDIVDICTPNDQHCPAILSAIANQKHIYCDKPLTATLEEAEQIAAALKNYHGTAQMTLQNRFLPAPLRAKQLIEEGAIGDVLEFRTAYLHAGSADPKAPLKWKLSGKAGGGVIADLGSHILDLTEHLIGPFDSLLATTHIAYPMRPSADDPTKMVPVDAEDNMNVIVRLPNGASGTVTASKIATGAEDEIRVEIHGSKGALRFNGMKPHGLQFYDCSAQGSPIGGRRGWTTIDTGQRFPAPANFPGPKFAIGWLRGHMQCLYNFLDAVNNGLPGNPDLMRGVEVQRMLEKVRQSAKDNAWVNL